MRRRGLWLAPLVLLLALPAAAQQEMATVGRVFFVKPKAGMQQQYEAAYKKHLAWHKAQNDTWSWFTWEFETGDRIGQYVTGTFDHAWADFDAHAKMDEADGADFAANAGALVESLSGIIVAPLPVLSNPPAGATGPLALATVYTFHLNIGHDREWANALNKITQALKKANWGSAYEWYLLLNGTEHPTYYLVLPRTNWAGFAPPPKPLWVVLEEVLGRVEAQTIMQTLDKSVHCQRSELIRFRPDLSYTPAPPPR